MKGRYILMSVVFSLSVQLTYAIDYYWIGNGGNWQDVAHWSLTSGGTSAGVIPTIDDNVFFDANSFTLPGQVVTIADDGSNKGVDFSIMDWRGVTNVPTFRVRVVTSPYLMNYAGGSIYFDDNMILDFDGAEFYFASNSNYELDTRGHYMGMNCWLAFNYNIGLPGYAGANVTGTLLSPLNHVWIYISQGILNANGNTITPQTDGQPYNDVWLVGNPNPASLDISGTSIQVGKIFIQNSSTIIDDNATITVKREIAATGQNFNHIITSDSINVNGSNSFERLELLPGSHLVTSGTNTVINFLANGTNELSIGLTGGTLTKNSGVVDAFGVRITDNTATGGAVFNAYASTSSGTVTGWNFFSVVPSDSLALVSIYNATGGAGWTNKTNWLTSPVNAWYGVTVTNGRVTGLNLFSNNLVGNIPTAISNLSALTTLDLNDNRLTGLPDLSVLTALTALNLNNNLFTFEDLQPNISIPGLLQPPSQRLIPVGTSTSVNIGGSYSITASIGGTGNLYQWVKNFSPISGATSSTYSVAVSAPTDAGKYRLRITNPGVPGLTLETTDFTVDVLSLAAPFEDGYQFSKKLGAEALGITQFKMERMAVGSSGNIYAYSTLSPNAIYKFNASGNLITTIDLANRLTCISDLSVDAADALYITSECSENLVKFDASGNFVYEITNTDGTYGNAIDPTDGNVLFLPRAMQPYTVRRHDSATSLFIDNITLTGGPSSGIYLDIEVDGSGNIYALAPSDGRIDKFSSTGVFISSIDLTAVGYTAWTGFHFIVAANGDIYLQGFNWSSGGSKLYHFNNAGSLVGTYGNNELITPWDVAETATGILVSDADLGLVLFSTAGNFINIIGPQKNANGQFNGPAQIATDSKGFRYVADRNNHRIQKLDKNGNWLLSFGSRGVVNGQFNRPGSIAIDQLDNVYVADDNNNRIQKFNSSGTHLLTFGSAGSGNGQFLNPVNIAISKTGEIVVADKGNSRVQVFQADGTFVSSFGTNGSGQGQFTNLQSLTIESDSTILTADGTRLQRFTHTGVFKSQLEIGGAVSAVSSITADSVGYFYVAGAGVVKKFDKRGGLVANIGLPVTNSAANGEVDAVSVSTNFAGDTLWIADNTGTNRISIFTTVFTKAKAADSLALVDLYNSTGGTSWTNKANWLTGPVSSWYGVTMTGDRVTALNLSSNQLTGAIPTTLVNLSSLATLNISDNQLTDLPDLRAFSLITTLNIRDNLFTFEDLEPNAAITGINYNPQKSFGSVQSLTLSFGSPLDLSFVVGGSANNYQWQKGGVNVGGNSTTFSVPSVTTADAGTYTLRVTSALVQGLTLTSASQVVNVKLDALFEWADGGELTLEGLNATPQQTTDQNYGSQWGDFNNDGYEDVFVTGFQSQERSYLYKNNGDGTFSKLPNSAYYFTSGRSVTWGDYNNDGFLDAFAPSYAAPDSVAFSAIFKNNGNETFTRIPIPGTSPSGTWSDIDNDGDLDLLYIDETVGIVKLVLYRNDGGDNFTAIADAFTSYTGWNPMAVDVNNDNLLDVFLPNGTTQSSSNTRALYINKGDGTFTLNATTPLVTDVLTSDRGASWADIDNDGDYDAFMVNGTEHRFYINDGSGNFTAKTSLDAFGETIKFGRGSVFADYDNDGFVDLLVTSGLTSSAIQWNLFHNNGNGTFTKVTTQNFRVANPFIGASFGDYDNDGFLDIISASFGQDYNGLYRNRGNSNNWLQVKLVGNISNKSGIGAKIDLYDSGLRVRQQILTNNGAHNQNSLIAQFGLGTSTAIDSIIISWPSGLQQKVESLAINRRWIIKENNFEIDSLALVAFYNATGGPDWKTRNNWLTGPVTTWAGVTFAKGNVTAINLPDNNITGIIPDEFTNMVKLQTINLSGNRITAIPDLTNLPSLISLNVSSNALDFSSLEKNASVTGINYGNQAGLGVATDSLVAVGTDYILSIDARGVADQYQWKRNGTAVPGATSKVYTIEAINRSNMGDYMCEITNPNAPDLVLTSARQRVLATATLQGRLLVGENKPAIAGNMTLFNINSGAFDTTAVRSVNPDGTYLIEKVVLDDYVFLGYADTLSHIAALPTYYTKTIYWEEADTLFVEDNLNALDIISEFKPAPPANGVGQIFGFFEGEDNAGGRTQKAERVKNAGASLRRVERTNRTNGIKFTLIAHTFTNEEGEFDFSKLDPGEYRLNIQYPGFPMDTTSFIDITIGTGLFDKQVALEAKVVDGKIVVTKRIITGWEETNVPYSVYPNPVKDVIHIQHKTGSTERLSIEFMNNKGQIIGVPIRYESGKEEWVLDVSKLAFGNYLIRVKDGDSSTVLRVVITE